AGAALPHARPLPGGGPSALSRLHHRVLGRAGHERRAPPVRGGDDGVHPGRDRPRGARPGGDLRRRVPALPGARGDARPAVAEAVTQPLQRAASVLLARLTAWAKGAATIPPRAFRINPVP